MAIIKSILKIMLYFLIAVLTILLSPFIALILFYPFKYKIKLDIENKSHKIYIYVSWFFKVFQYCKNDKTSFLKFFGFKKRKKTKKTKTETSKSCDISEEIIETSETTEKNENKAQIKDTKLGIFEKLQAIINKISYYKNYPERSEIIKLTLNFIKKLIQKNKPKNISIIGTVGFETPDKTGIFLGFLSVINSYLMFNLDILGDFEKEILELNINIDGKLILWKAIYPTIKYILKDPILKIVKKLLSKKNKQERNEEVYV